MLLAECRLWRSTAALAERRTRPLLTSGFFVLGAWVEFARARLQNPALWAAPDKRKPLPRWLGEGLGTAGVHLKAEAETRPGWHAQVKAALPAILRFGSLSLREDQPVRLPMDAGPPHPALHRVVRLR